MTIIKDGTGSERAAKVNSDNRLHTNAITISDAGKSNIDGKLFIAGSLDVTLTTANESAVFYLKNSGTETILTDIFTISVGTSTNGTGTSLNRLVRNPTAGTIVSNAVAMSVVNSNFGSAKVLTADSFVGVEGDTMTGGTEFSRAELPTSFVVADLNIVLPPGASMGFLFTPPTGNTSQDISISIQLHLDGFGE